MEVDAHTVVCYRCYKEGHMRNECTAKDQASFRKVVHRPDKTKTVAATSTEKGKGKEFVEGSSKDLTKDEVGSSKVTDLERHLKEMTVQFGKLLSIVQDKEKDF